jgi:hypothetical protein
LSLASTTAPVSCSPTSSRPQPNSLDLGSASSISVVSEQVTPAALAASTSSGPAKPRRTLPKGNEKVRGPGPRWRSSSSSEVARSSEKTSGLPLKLRWVWVWLPISTSPDCSSSRHWA